MGSIIHFDFGCDVTGASHVKVTHTDHQKKVEVPKRKLIVPIVPTTDEVEASGQELKFVSHAADPIKSLSDIERVSDYFIEHGQYRNNMMFIMGINFGLRYSDLSSLKFSDILDEEGGFKETVEIFEKKTSNTRKVKKTRLITINEAVMDAVELYVYNTKHEVNLSDYLFMAIRQNYDSPLTTRSANRIFNQIAIDLGLDIKFSTHTLRKTFGYHQMRISNNDPRKLLLLQRMFNHSTPNQTLTYIGLTREEIADAYLELNLGKRPVFDSELVEVKEEPFATVSVAN